MKELPMDCQEAQARVLDEERGRLAPALAATFDGHLAGCAGCRAFKEREKALTGLLEEKLPRYAAPLALKKRLEASWPAKPTARPRLARMLVPAFGAAAAALLVGLSTAALVQQRANEQGLFTEAVNDHLRVLQGAPLAQVAGGLHEVKPWFGGKLDFAPEVSFAGDAEFPLQGGAVEPFLDRRAAVFVFKRRLHTISLFVVRPEGLEFPARLKTVGVRGFNVAVWRAGDQGFALASELSLPELLELQKRLVPGG